MIIPPALRQGTTLLFYTVTPKMWYWLFAETSNTALKAALIIANDPKTDVLKRSTSASRLLDQSTETL